ncbi:MAG: polysaccharide deacetylase family protein [Clostridiales bacterium]|nr:polysaccharide deacetylase family protein [Clostridiales bacterium]
MGKSRLSLWFAKRTVKRRLGALISLSLLLFGPGVSARSDAVVSFPNTENKIALTFDDGPHPQYTEEILDILAENDIKATFFIIGQNAEKYPEIVQRIVNEGHEIGNHTYTHPHMRATSKEKLNEEIEKTEKLLEGICSYKPVLFRPPEGFCCSTVENCAKGYHYHIMLWDIDTCDWAHNSVGNIVKTVVGKAKTGDIILCHDFVTKPSPTPEAILQFIPRLKAKGFEFVTVSELLESEHV